VAHLNHGLRGEEAAADAEFVRQEAERLGLPSTIGYVDVASLRKQWRTSLEGAARRARYQFLSQVVAACRAWGVAVGHTADDQAETILLHWLRGAGPAGLIGMPVVQTLPVGETFLRIVRPLLEMTRLEIEAFCQERGLTPRYDTTNASLRMQRNRIRHILLPALRAESPRVVEHILTTARVLRDESVYLDDEVSRHWPVVVRAWPGGLGLSLSRLRDMPPSLQRRLIRQAWACLAADQGELSYRHIEELRSLAHEGPAGGRISLPGRVTAWHRYTEIILLAPGAQEDEPPIPLAIVTQPHPVAVPGQTPLTGTPWALVVEKVSPGATGGPLSVVIATDAVRERLTLRNREPGDRISLRGVGGSKKVHDVLVDAKIPRSWRDRLVLVADGKAVVWISGVRVNDYYLPGPETLAAWRLTWERVTGS